MARVTKFFLIIFLGLSLLVLQDDLVGFDLSKLEITMEDLQEFPGLPGNIDLSKIGVLDDEGNNVWWNFINKTPKKFHSAMQAVDFKHNGNLQRIIISILHFPGDKKRTKMLFHYQAGLFTGMNSGYFGEDDGLSNGETFGEILTRFDMEKYFPFTPEVASQTLQGNGKMDDLDPKNTKDGFGGYRAYNVYYLDNDIGIIILGQREIYDLRPLVDHIARVLNRKIHPPTKK